MNEVVLVPHDDQWLERYKAERRRLSIKFNGSLADIQHVGSTAIPGIAAKPVIDILITVWEFPPTSWFHSGMLELGYGRALGPDQPQLIKTDGPQHWIYRNDARGISAHVYWTSDPGAEEMILFRDYLREHPEAAAEYEEIKLRLASEGRGFHHYTLSKTSFVIRIIGQIRESGHH